MLESSANPKLLKIGGHMEQIRVKSFRIQCEYEASVEGVQWTPRLLTQEFLARSEADPKKAL